MNSSHSNPLSLTPTTPATRKPVSPPFAQSLRAMAAPYAQYQSLRLAARLSATLSRKDSADSHSWYGRSAPGIKRLSPRHPVV